MTVEPSLPLTGQSTSLQSTAQIIRPVWIVGGTRAGKTTRLVQYLCTWATVLPSTPNQMGALLVFAATGDNRLALADRITTATQGRYPIRSTTPLGFFQDEITLFWPLLIEKLNLRAQFPLRLRPETEQELATRLWQPELKQGLGQLDGLTESRMVRRLLDLWLLAASAGLPVSELGTLLEQGISGALGNPEVAAQVQGLVQRWRDWCLQQGLLTYSLATDLYGQVLLPDTTYQASLCQRYLAILADDVDNYPAIARALFEHYLDQQRPVALTFNPDGCVRLGLGADPDHLAELANVCRVEMLPPAREPSLATDWAESMIQWVCGDLNPWDLPPSPVPLETTAVNGDQLTGEHVTTAPPIQVIQTISRAQLLRQLADIISDGIQSGQVQPQEVAVIGPGLDAIARYTLTTILQQREIPVQSLHDQSPLNSSPLIRALLTLLPLVYPGLGRLIDRAAIAEMLIILSYRIALPPLNQSNWPDARHASYTNAPTSPDEGMARPYRGVEGNGHLPLHPCIDPVRAGLLADHCFAPHPDTPRLLPVTAFPRWDRLGYEATRSYEKIIQWLDTQRVQQQQRLLTSPIILIDRAIQQFLWNGTHLPSDQLAALRELLETAQHYWEVANRLHKTAQSAGGAVAPVQAGGGRDTATLASFIQLLRSGTVTANPYPTNPLGQVGRREAVTLATVFQYRANRANHRWQFWLDAGSTLWLTGVDSLFGAPIFLHQWSGRRWTEADTLAMGEERLRRIIRDLLSRTSERVYLCHSELATNGQEQMGPLLSLIHAIAPIDADLTDLSG